MDERNSRSVNDRTSLSPSHSTTIHLRLRYSPEFAIPTRPRLRVPVYLYTYMYMCDYTYVTYVRIYVDTRTCKSASIHTYVREEKENERTPRYQSVPASVKVIPDG